MKQYRSKRNNCRQINGFQVYVILKKLLSLQLLILIQLSWLNICIICMKILVMVPILLGKMIICNLILIGILKLESMVCILKDRMNITIIQINDNQLTDLQILIYIHQINLELGVLIMIFMGVKGNMKCNMKLVKKNKKY